MTSLKAKVNAYDNPTSRPNSPFKAQPSPVAVRPKAKINTSAAFGPRKLTGPSSVSSPRSAVSTSRAPSPFKASPGPPRAPSPFKPSQRYENQSLPTSASVQARLTAPRSTLSVSPRATPTQSNPPSPESKRRRPSLTIRSSKSAVSLAQRTAPPSPLVPNRPLKTDRQTSPVSSSLRISQTSSTVSRVTATATKMAKSNSQGEPNYPISSPLNVPGRVPFNRPRVPSVSNMSMLSSSHSSVSSVPPSKISNMTKHKRGISQTKSDIYQPFQIDDDQTIHRNTYNSTRRVSVAKVDPSLIPLPPISPPTSNISFSSSRSSQSSAASYNSHYSARSARSPIPSFNPRSNGFSNADSGDASSSRTRTAYNQSREGSPPSDTDPGDRRMKAEAKSIRKIADLEITNRSLMVINATLEAAKHRQAKEIRDLRRKLRESRLILPPQTYRQVKSSDDTPDYDDDLDDEDDDDDLNDDNFKDDKDEGFKRVRTILDGLLEEGHKALETKAHELEERDRGPTTKVLHAEELHDDDFHEFSEADITLPDSDDLDEDSDSEDEVEGMISIRITPSPP